jgi:hypothetical protein
LQIAIIGDAHVLSKLGQHVWTRIGGSKPRHPIWKMGIPRRRSLAPMIPEAPVVRL